MTQFSNGTPVADALSISGLSTLAAGAYSAPSALLDNTPSGPRGFSFLSGSLRLVLSPALTAASGSPYLTAYFLQARDGSSVANPPGAAAIAPPANAPQCIAQLPSGGAFGIVDFNPIELDPMLYAIQLYNASGVAFSGTVTATLYRWLVWGV